MPSRVSFLGKCEFSVDSFGVLYCGGRNQRPTRDLRHGGRVGPAVPGMNGSRGRGEAARFQKPVSRSKAGSCGRMAGRTATSTGLPTAGRRWGLFNGPVRSTGLLNRTAGGRSVGKMWARLHCRTQLAANWSRADFAATASGHDSGTQPGRLESLQPAARQPVPLSSESCSSAG